MSRKGVERFCDNDMRKNKEACRAEVWSGLAGFYGFCGTARRARMSVTPSIV